LSREANIDTSNKTATLWGYLKFTDCDAQITEYGFYYCPSDGCIPTENSKVVLQAQHQGTTGIQRGTEFSAVLNYTEGVRYGYRSYAVVNGKVRLSKEVRYFGSSQCNPQLAGQPINVTVDGAQYGIDYADNCNLIYGNLQLALDNLESHEKGYIVDGALQQDITITVFQLDNKGTYTGKTKTVSGGTGGGTRSLNVNVIEDINKNQNDNYKLTIKAAEGHNPRIQHLLIRESRNIEIDGLNIISNPTNNGETEDTALEIDAGKCSDWVNVSRELENANILIKNCMIGSNGFTGVHATGCSGISFENNTFNLIVNVPENKDDAEYSNIVGWGASAKFFACKNIKFVRNNFMGAHPTLVWLQQSSNALFYNNVFWNTNEFVGECVAVRLVNQWGNNSVGNIAFFYNTFYLADNDNNKNYDFLRYKIDVASAFDESSVYFQYNNCYSYDTDIPGKASSGNSFVNGHYCPNNYWSIKSDAKFDIKDCGDDTKNINVSNYVCETSASGPASLIIKQPADPNDAGLKVGTPLELTYIQTAVGTDTDIPFKEEDLTDDRYNENIREGNAWTLGAYEQSASNNVETIYWVGGVDNNWDNRNNWVRIDETTGQERRLTCVDNLSPNLKIIIPQENSTQYPISTTGKYFYPEIPASFDATERENTTIGLVSETKGIPASEQVSAGVGYPGDPAKYAKTIELEYGAALKGVHRLDGRYDEAISHMTVGRDEWTLVGTIVKPADGNGGYRFITSNDYFCNYTPQVYMHQAEIVQEGEFANATWGDTFADLDKGVEPTTVYAINVPDQYGKYKAPSRIYYKGLAGGTNDPDKLQDGVKPHSFGPFTGRFVNDASMPEYGNLTSGTAYLFNNSYPCNIDPEEIQKSGLGNIMCYDYDGGAFVSIDARAVESTLKPQHGFIFIPASNGTLTIDENWLVDGETKSRSAQYEEPIFSIQLDNAEYGLHGYSNLVVKRDELLADNEDSPLNVRKVIAPNENTPEIYAIAFDEELARICVNNMSKTIPLGIYLHKPMKVKFSKCYSKNVISAILVDTYTNKEYDLMDRSFTTETLASGNLDGRFFLNLTTLDEDYYVEDEEDDDNVSTDVEENTLDENAINIFVRESDNAIRVLTSGVELREIYVSDMSGRTMRYNVNGYSASIKLPVPNGVYLVQVIGDKLTRTEKVILK
ncbi:MAG: T9SS type A sorting domain-containing protein, partial [Paludibacteraceae bacterium]|nr:T9SS type A sorting domain-containing protein [Paludibacteraceae bacterium]